MHPQLRMRQYQHQSIATASPERLVAKLFDLGVAACHRGDRPHLRAVLVELVGGLDFERGGELAQRLHGLYTFCLAESNDGSLDVVATILGGLREAWQEGVLKQPLAA